ncbi:MAG: NifB/NifX family molybdenum-iron cluster-binding protein [Desulfobacterales bacterium]
MKRIAIPVFENRISNRLDCCENIILYSIYRSKIQCCETVRLVQASPSEKLNMLLEMGIDVLICNGITAFYSRKLSEKNIQVIPWVSGEVKKVVNQYLNHKLAPRNSEERFEMKKMCDQSGGDKK